MLSDKFMSEIAAKAMKKDVPPINSAYTAKINEAYEAVFDSKANDECGELFVSAFSAVLTDMLSRESGAQLMIHPDAEKIAERIAGMYYPQDKKREDDGKD